MPTPHYGHIGIIGVGAMGAAIANRLLDLNYKIIIYDKNDEAIRPFLEKKITTAKTIKEITTNCSTVFTVLSHPSNIKEIYLGDQGIVQNLDIELKSQVFIDLSTSSASLSLEIAKALKLKHKTFFDIGMLGNPPTARTGSMTLLVGGDENNLAGSVDLLKSIAANVCYIGPTGSGHAAKLIANQLFLAQVAAMGEALAIVKVAGLNAEKFLEALACTGGRGAGLADIGKAMLKPSETAGFKAELAAKDANLLKELTSEIGYPGNMANLLSSLYSKAAIDNPFADYTNVYQILLKMHAGEIINVT